MKKYNQTMSEDNSPPPGIWDVLRSTIDSRHPYLARLRVAPISTPPLPYEHCETLPDFLQIAALVADTTNFSPDNHRLSMVFPRLEKSAFWIALGACLSAMKRDFQGALANLPHLEIGQKVLLDKKRYLIYEGETHLNGKSWLRLRDKVGTNFFPLTYRLRLQPTDSKRLSRVPWAGNPPFDLLDELLQIEAYGARDIFQTRVVLVCPVARMALFARENALSICDEQSACKIVNLFQMGSLSREGEVEIMSTGQFDAEPVLLLCPDLIALRTYLRARARKKKDLPLVILDGSRSFKGHESTLTQIIEEDAPVMACLERGEEEFTRLLEEHEFSLWRWTERDFLELQSSLELPPMRLPQRKSLFTSLEKACDNFARRNVYVRLCDCPKLDEAAVRFMDWQDASDDDALKSTLWNCLLYATRCVVNTTSIAKCLAEKISLAENEIEQTSWLTSEQREEACQILQLIQSAETAAGQSEASDKISALRELATTAPITVILADEESVQAARERENSLGQVRFCSPSTVEKALRESEENHLILCGWLGPRRTRELLDGCLAADITILLYPFEQKWLQRATKRWRGVSTPLTNRKRMQWLKLPGQEALPADAWDNVEEPDAFMSLSSEADTPDKRPFDIENFEMRLYYARCAELGGARQNEEQEEARLVEFSGGQFAWISSSFRLPVVTELLMESHDISPPKSLRKKEQNKELPRKKAEELSIGDYVVFRRGAQGDLLREIADVGLRKQNLGHLREISQKWKTALNEWREEEKERLEDKGKKSKDSNIIKRLQELGIQREGQTIRGWFDPDLRIGPSDEDTLRMIAKAIGNKELEDEAAQVWQAISRVKSAHMQASGHLREILLHKLSATLRDGTDEWQDGALEINTDSGEAIVVCVEEISPKTMQVGRSLLNQLRHAN